eukprot:COSAG03_NODE_27612_length_252_cov_0.673203_1_plen_27_part_01
MADLRRSDDMEVPIPANMYRPSVCLSV